MGIFSREKEKSFFDQAKQEQLAAFQQLASKQLVEITDLQRRVDQLIFGNESLHREMLGSVENIRLRIKIANRAIQSKSQNEEELIGLIKGYKLAIDEMATFINLTENLIR